MKARQPSPRSHAGPPSRRIVFVLIASLLFMQTGAPSFVASAQAAARSRAEVAEQTKAALAALATAVDDIPRVTFDVGAALAAAGGTVEGALAWVRDNTTLVPYAGSLRGPLGVLLDGSGNSLDRALLLVALVEDSGGVARLAHGVLAGAVLEQVNAVSAAPGVREDAEPTTDAAALAAEHGLEPGFLAEAAEAANADAVALETGLDQRVEPQAAFLLQAVPELASTDELATDLLSDHWWAQYQVGGDWVDLDPTLPDAVPGATLVPAEEYLAPSELPVQSHHTVRLEVVLECVADGALTEHVLVASEDLRAENLLGQRLAVQYIPVTLDEDVDPAIDQAAFQELILGQDLWFPVLSLGGQSLYDVQFDADCVTSPATPPWLGAAVAGALDAADDLFGDLFGPAPEDAVTALFIDYHLNVPGEGTRVVRRPVFDVLGPAARAKGAFEATVDPAERLAWRLALLGETEVLITPGRLSEPFVTDLLARSLLGQREAIEALADAGSGAEAEAVAATATANAQLPSALYGLALARQSRLTAGVFLDGLTIVNRHNQAVVGADGAVRRMQAFDIVTNPVASVTGSRSDVVRQGVVDTNVESLIGRNLCESDITTEFCVVAGNPADALARTGADASGWLVLTDRGELASAGLAWSPDAIAALETDLAAGYTVIVPTSAPEVEAAASWWRIDPATGATLGVNELGWGPSMAEYSLIVNLIAFGFCEVGAVGGGAAVGGTMLCVFGLATGTGAVVAGTGGVAGALMIASAVLYGIGGLGYPKD